MIAIALFPLLALGAGSLNPTALRSEYRTDPSCLGETRPRLEWKLTAVDPEARGLRQTGYEVLVASSADKLSGLRPDLWDSGKVPSDQTNQIVYAGQPLTSREACWWKVRVWDQAGVVSDWSAPARWTMGLLDASEWKAEWIGLDAQPPRDGSVVPEGDRMRLANFQNAQPPIAESRKGPLTAAIRRGFTLPSGCKVARVVFTALPDQICDISVNGRKLGRIVRWEAIVPFDLTDAVVPGDNVLGLMVTDQDGYRPSVQGELEIDFADGHVVRFPTNETWHYSMTPRAGWDTAIRPEDNWAPLALFGRYYYGNQFNYFEPAPYLRRGFTIAKPVRRATVYATALGDYELHLNGGRVGRDYFTPGWTDYRRRVPYQAYDVTGLLHKGENALGAILGDGWYAGTMGNSGERHYYGGYARFAAQLEIEYTDGTTERVATDGTWRGAFGPIKWADHMEGYAYDARLELGDWAGGGFDDSKWSPVATGQRRTVPGEPPKIAIEPDTIEPVRITDEMPARSVRETEPGVWLVDFGQILVGWVRMQVNGKAGQKITIRHGEMLNADGTLYTTNLKGAACTDIYWLRGGGEERLEPRFTFRSFRYAEIRGLDAAPDAATLKAIVAGSLQAPTGSFACSDARLNQLFSNIVWTQKSNYLSTTTDCPNRDERLGWTGDAQLFLRTGAFNFDVASFMERWLVSMRDGQGEEGLFCPVTPVAGGGSPTPMTGWCGDAAVVCTYLTWRTYGDTRVIERNFDALNRYLDWLQLSSQHGVSSTPVGGGGDWLNLGGAARQDVMDTAYLAYDSRMMSEMAAAIGRKGDGERFAKLQKETTAAFQQAFFLPDGGIRDSSQTGYALAFANHLVPDELRAKAAGKFVDEIAGRNWHLATGLLGTEPLLPALHLAGRDNVAYRLLLQDTFPSWLFLVKNGATTIWERWDGWTPDKGFQSIAMNSFNHYAFGSVGEFLYRYVAGMDTDGPGFRHILIQPLPGGGLTEAHASYEAITGRIESGWKIDGDKLLLDAVIPPNTTATLLIPAPEGTPVLESDKPANTAPGVKFAGASASGLCFQIASGAYHFAVRRPGAAAPKPTPTYSNISYGPHPHNILDIYLPPGTTKPAPAVIWYNGIWKADKNVPPIDHFFPAHCAAVSVETRVMGDAIAEKNPTPISVVDMDAVRALQFVRLHAAQWNLDPNRLAVAGGSQAAIPALYVACAGEKANPGSADPVERVSSKVVCAGSWCGPGSVDPKVLLEWAPGDKWGAPALGCSFDESLARRDQLLPAIELWSPDALLTKDAPPIFIEYALGTTRPAEISLNAYLAHSPLLAVGFQNLSRQRGATCYVKFPGHPSEKYDGLWDFLVKQLTQP